MIVWELCERIRQDDATILFLILHYNVYIVSLLAKNPDSKVEDRSVP